MEIVGLLSQIIAFIPLWVYLTIAAVICWSLCCYYDSILVDGVFRNPDEGGVIAGRYALYPAIIFVGLMLYNSSSAPPPALLLAMIGGGLFLFHYHYLYRVLHLYNDSAWVDAIANSSIILVPPMLFIVGLASFSWGHVLGACIASIGTLWLILKKWNKVSRNKTKFIMLILTLALSLVVMDYSYAISDDKFFNVIGFFFLGMYACGWILRFNFGNGERIKELVTRYRFRFIFINSIDLLGMLFFQWAIAKTPSLSFVMILEGFTPVVTMSIAVAIFLFTKTLLRTQKNNWFVSSSNGSGRKGMRHTRNIRIASGQLNFGLEKLVPIAFLAWGGFIIYYDHVIQHDIQDGYLILKIPLTTADNTSQPAIAESSHLNAPDRLTTP